MPIHNPKSVLTWVLLFAVLLMQGVTLIQMSANKKEAVERHSDLTRIELQNQKAFTDSIRRTVESMEARQTARIDGDKQSNGPLQPRTGPTVQTHP